MKRSVEFSIRRGRKKKINAMPPGDLRRRQRHDCQKNIPGGRVHSLSCSSATLSVSTLSLPLSFSLPLSLLSSRSRWPSVFPSVFWLFASSPTRRPSPCRSPSSSSSSSSVLWLALSTDNRHIRAQVHPYLRVNQVK